MSITIIGNGGAGKSTLAHRLGKDLNIPVTHLDKISWTKDYTPIPRMTFNQALEAIMTNKDWIIEGWAYHDTLLERLEAADVIIHLDYPYEFCLESALKRNREYHQKAYPFDPFEGDRNSKEDLLKLAIKTVAEVLEPEARNWIETLAGQGKKVYRYMTRKELNESYESMIDEIKQM